jgi:hypothetical protein
MIRTVWLTIACLAVLGAFAVSKAFTTPAAPTTTERQLHETALDSAPGQQSLPKADRLEITYVRRETPDQPTFPDQSALMPSEPRPSEPIRSAVPSIVPPAGPKIVSRHWHDPHATAAKSKQSKQAAANKKSRNVDPRNSRAADRSKPTEQVKPCAQPGAVGNLLRSLNLSPACDASSS